MLSSLSPRPHLSCVHVRIPPVPVPTFIMFYFLDRVNFLLPLRPSLASLSLFLSYFLKLFLIVCGINLLWEWVQLPFCRVGIVNRNYPGIVFLPANRLLKARQLHLAQFYVIWVHSPVNWSFSSCWSRLNQAIFGALGRPGSLFLLSSANKFWLKLG